MCKIVHIPYMSIVMWKLWKYGIILVLEYVSDL